MSGTLRHRFVDTIPDTLEPDTLYVSLEYLTTSHLCACGCGEEVVLPLHPTKWRVTFDGATVSMHPSIGSRTLPCRSHYWIERGRVRWDKRMSESDFERALARDQRADSAWHGRDLPNRAAAAEGGAPAVPAPAPSPAPALERGGWFVRALAAVRSKLLR